MPIKTANNDINIIKNVSCELGI